MLTWKVSTLKKPIGLWTSVSLTFWWNSMKSLVMTKSLPKPMCLSQSLLQPLVLEFELDHAIQVFFYIIFMLGLLFSILFPWKEKGKAQLKNKNKKTKRHAVSLIILNLFRIVGFWVSMSRLIRTIAIVVVVIIVVWSSKVCTLYQLQLFL